jgi:hypothetical protein
VVYAAGRADCVVLGCRPVARRCCLAEVSRAFRTHFWGVAYASRPLQLNLNVLSWRIAQSKRKKAMREELQAAVARAAPSTASLVLKYQLDPICKLPLASLLAPLAPHIQVKAGTETGHMGATLPPSLRGTLCCMDRTAMCCICPKACRHGYLHRGYLLCCLSHPSACSASADS